MNKVLIIGCRGMLGQELVKVFESSKKYAVNAWDLAEIDITDEAQVLGKISALAPQIIINAAAYNDVDKAEGPEGHDRAMFLNDYAPGYLAHVAKRLDVILVHYSTDYVFDGENPEGYWENSQPNPISFYGESKLWGEKKIRYTCEKYYIIRLQKLFGQPGKSDLAKKSFFSKMLEQAKKQDVIKVVDSELGYFTYAPDLAERTKYLIEHELPWGIYHITNEGRSKREKRPVTWLEGTRILLALAHIKNVTLVPPSAMEFVRPARRPRFAILQNSKLQPMRSWIKALKEFLEIKEG